MPAVKHLTPEQVAAGCGGTLIDVREFPEFAAGAIRGARLVPLGTLAERCRDWNPGDCHVLVCRSGKRAAQAARTLEGLGFQDLAILEGGVEAWRAAGLPLQVAARRPWPLERQVRAIAGTLVLLSTGLGLAVSPWFFLLTSFVGGGLLFSGVTDICLLATLLGKLPWNRAASSCSPSA
jgi:rhodanese-related sulfurtransferase